MSQVNPIYKTVSALFIALTVILATSTGYLLTSSAPVQAQTMTVTSTEATTVSASQYSVNVAYSPTLGFYLTNGTGYTLYIFTLDDPTSGTSRCTGKCVSNWPAFYTEDLNLPPGLNANSFSEITRPDGSSQLAYSGYPLYTFANDKKPGDMTGQGIKGVWFACTIPNLTLHT